jgi:pyruvate/2-oxoglutarate dehydrogenase complex dihydrolipoamide acyltransferase (E2) component
MKQHKGYKSVPLGFNRKMVIVSAGITRQRNIIHCITEVDISKARERIRNHFEKTGEKLSFTAYIVTCLAKIISQNPALNSFIRGRRIILLDEVTVSVLVERELEGEKVPEPIGISGAGTMSFYEVSTKIREAQKKQGERIGSLSGMTWVRFIPQFLLKTFIRIADKNLYLAKKYGKIAVTAVGMNASYPLWFIPHGSATVLLTIGSINRKTVYIEGEFTAREYLCLTVSFDHDIIDGAPATRFMNQLIEKISSADLIDPD